ncbi:MAG: hypothetical protein HY360_05205 [Verrucomicrobia bacterium]|nr:hypothetical protein [Verrucomicrobiota bacterium]
MKRIQIQLTNKKLDDVVQEMAEACAHRLEKDTSRGADRVAVIRGTIREVLEKYVHAYDLCGLATVCQEAQEVDPWGSKVADEE